MWRVTNGTHNVATLHHMVLRGLYGCNMGRSNVMDWAYLLISILVAQAMLIAVGVGIYLELKDRRPRL